MSRKLIFLMQLSSYFSMDEFHRFSAFHECRWREGCWNCVTWGVSAIAPRNFFSPLSFLLSQRSTGILLILHHLAVQCVPSHLLNKSVQRTNGVIFFVRCPKGHSMKRLEMGIYQVFGAFFSSGDRIGRRFQFNSCWCNWREKEKLWQPKHKQSY